MASGLPCTPDVPATVRKRVRTLLQKQPRLRVHDRGLRGWDAKGRGIKRVHIWYKGTKLGGHAAAAAAWWGLCARG